MSSIQPSISDPCKFGLLIQCRMKMDKLNDNQLYDYTNTILQSLSIKSLKKLLFVGFNSIKDDISYNMLFQMKTSINTIIKDTEKLKNTLKSKQVKSILNKQKTTPKVPKNASLTKTIPFDIISNNICPFLKMSSITKLAKCDRKSAIICHTPTSIKNLMHRYDPYEYTVHNNFSEIMIDGHYNINTFKLINPNIHRFRNVEKLSINIDMLSTIDISSFFHKVKQLSFFGDTTYPLTVENASEAMLPLETISFVNTFEMRVILSFIQKYKTKLIQLKSISFVDCLLEMIWENDNTFDNFSNIVDLILPTQPNLEVLKLENSYLETNDDDSIFVDVNKQFEKIDKITSSMSNLKGFVYAKAFYSFRDNLFATLSTNILSNLRLFNKLTSLHTHSLDNDLLSLYLNHNNRNVLNNISELCISIPMLQYGVIQLNSINILLPNIEKLCLVFHDFSKPDNYDNILDKIKCILRSKCKLKLFQLEVQMIDCNEDEMICNIETLTEFTKKLIELIRNFRNDVRYSTIEKQPLVFKYHVKLCNKSALINLEEIGSFSDVIQNMILTYSITYPIGKMQFKISWNVDHIYICDAFSQSMKGLNNLVDVTVKTGGSLKRVMDNCKTYCDNAMDYEQYAISATAKNIVEKGIEHEKKWNVDCRYCCNTPWV